MVSVPRDLVDLPLPDGRVFRPKVNGLVAYANANPGKFPGATSGQAVLAAGLITLARTIPGVTVAGGYALADTIHNTGQAIVWTGVKETAELYWEQLRDAGLTMAPLEQF